MRKRRIVILVIAIMFVFIWLFLFRKSFNENAVPANADMVAVVDVKNITRSYIKEFVLHPSRWLKVSISRKKEFSWKKVFKLPDYVCIFHEAGQGMGKWYTRLKIKNRERFDKAIEKFHFKKYETGNFVLYSSANPGVHFLVFGDEAIAATYSCKLPEVLQTGNDLFIDKKVLNKKNTEKFIQTSHHLIFLFRNGNYFQHPGTVYADVEGGEITVSGKLFPVVKSNPQIGSESDNLNNILDLNLAPLPQAYLKYFPDSLKQKWSKAIGLPVDSVFLNHKFNWSLHLSGFRERIDTAVTYNFDENFNEVPQATIVTSTVPVITLSASGEGAEQIYEMINFRNALEPENGKMRFTGFPLWPMYASSRPGEFVLGNAEGKEKQNSLTTSIMNLRANPSKIPDSLFRYIPDNLRSWLKNTQTIKLNLIPAGNAVSITGELIRENGTYF